MPTSPAHLPPQPPSLTSSTSHLSAPLEMGGSWEKQFFPVTHGLNNSENQNRMKVPTPGLRSNLLHLPASCPSRLTSPQSGLQSPWPSYWELQASDLL